MKVIEEEGNEKAVRGEKRKGKWKGERSGREREEEGKG